MPRSAQTIDFTMRRGIVYAQRNRRWRRTDLRKPPGFCPEGVCPDLRAFSRNDDVGFPQKRRVSPSRRWRFSGVHIMQGIREATAKSVALPLRLFLSLRLKGPCGISENDNLADC